MSSFRSIVFSSVLTGLIAGAAISAVHFVTTVPLILQAETYENAAPSEPHSHDAAPAVAPDAAAPAESATAEHAHEHGDGWAPADGLERNLYTVAANILTAIGYALVINGLVFVFGREGGWREGLLFGLAGFAAVTLAPGLGLHPELPGTPAGPLIARQVWWIATAAATAVALWLLVFRRAAWAAALAVALLVAPHLIGAPQPPAEAHALAPEALSQRFIVLVMVTGLLFWAMIGALSGLFARRFEA